MHSKPEFSNGPVNVSRRSHPRLVVIADGGQRGEAENNASRHQSAFWVRNFHYPHGLPRLAEAVIASIERGTIAAAARLGLKETQGLSFAWLGKFVYVSESQHHVVPATRPPRSVYFEKSIKQFPNLWRQTQHDIYSQLPDLLNRIAQASDSLKSLTPLWHEARNFCDFVWEQHFLLMYLSIIPWCEFQDLRNALKSDADVTASIPDIATHPGKVLRQDCKSEISWPLCAAGADIRNPFMTPRSNAASFCPGVVSSPSGLRSALDHFRYVQAARSAALTHFPSWNEAHTPWLDLSGAVPLKAVSERVATSWLTQGLIGSRDDIFHLWPHELESLLLAPTPEQIVVTKFQEPDMSLAVTEPPLTFGILPSMVTDPIFREIHGVCHSKVNSPESTGSMASERISGDPVSLGTATGIIVEVRNMSDLARITPVSIVLCEALLPEWTYGLGPVLGCIARRGGALSHSATVCRERQIPCVVGLGDLSLKLREGQRVTISGTTGVILIHAVEEV